MKDNPRISPQLALAVAALAGLVSGAALLTAPGWWPGQTLADGQAVQLKSHIPIDRYQVEAIYRRELTLQAWLETMTRTAQGEPGDFRKLIGSEPSARCTDRHWPATRQGQTPEPPDLATIERIFICNRVSAVHSSAPGLQWEEKLARAAALLWRGTSPEGAITLEVARQGYQATAEDNADLANYIANFQVCRTNPEIESWLQTREGDSHAAAENWLRMARSYELCAQAVEERLFPMEHQEKEDAAGQPAPH